MNKNAFIGEHGELCNGVLLNIAEILTLRLPEGAEKVVAAKWVKKFQACDPKSYKKYLSLFISSLTKQVLVEPFNVAPQEPREQWQELEKDFTTADINRAVKQRLFQDAKAPPYTIDISQDLHEFVALQEIPFFGAHFYYAFSPTETINQWRNFDKLKVPRKFTKDMPVDSPIKGRFGRKPVTVKTKAAAAKKPKPAMKSAKPQWEGPVEPEPEVEPEVKTTMITLPTDGPVKAIPAALQRRMLEAEKQKQERLAQKEQDRMEGSRSKTPIRKDRSMSSPAQAPKKSVDSPLPSVTPKPPSQISLRKKVLQKRAAEVNDSVLMSSDEQSLADDIVEIPAAIPEKLLRTTHALSNELNRNQREATANTAAVNAIQDQEINIGNEILNALGANSHKAELILENAGIIDEELKDICLNLTALNQKAAKPIVDSETIKRFNAIREQIGGVVINVISAATSTPNKTVKNAEHLLDLMNATVQEAQVAIDNLAQVQPTSRDEKEALLDLIANNNQLIDEIAVQVEPLIEAIENRDPNLAVIALETANDLSQAIQNSFDKDEMAIDDVQPTSIALKIADVEDERNLTLLETSTLAEAIAKKYEDGYVPQDPAVRRYLGLENVDEDVIDIDAIDLEFEGGAMTHEDAVNFSKTAKDVTNRNDLSQIFELIADEENLENITEDFNDIFDESILNLDEIIDQLDESLHNAGSQEERNAIDEIMGKVQSTKQDVDKSREEVNQAGRAKDLINFWENATEQNDLISFDDEDK